MNDLTLVLVGAAVGWVIVHTPELHVLREFMQANSGKILLACVFGPALLRFLSARPWT